ncbi:hypothetical protein MKW92_040499 [Papaver armeniacum]|nr:hypothetical protein MKW92_040499 [Papaver armeniacum]
MLTNHPSDQYHQTVEFISSSSLSHHHGLQEFIFSYVVGLLFALVVLSANLDGIRSWTFMQSWGVTECKNTWKLPSDNCFSVCTAHCPPHLRVDAYACVLNLLGISLNGCSCCFA